MTNKPGDAAKRCMDVAGAALGLALFSPVLALVALAVRVSLGSPILFRQERPGRGGRPFVLYKFRTLLDLRDDAGRPLPDAERMTRLGRFLRSSSLDELPSLLNVLRGDMSLVGPRPLLMEYLPLYSSEEARRHEVRPGITGWAQIHGRNALGWQQRFELDVWYVDNRSVRLDFIILLRTVGQVLRRSGVSQPGQVTMQRFRGHAR